MPSFLRLLYLSSFLPLLLLGGVDSLSSQDDEFVMKLSEVGEHCSSGFSRDSDFGTLAGSIVLVTTMDGQIRALDHESGDILWSHSSDRPLVSSTISETEITNQGKLVRMIPSLGGRLYQFDGEIMEAAPATAEHLLKSSYKFSDHTVITGGKESRSLGLNLETGDIRYECSMNGGCQQHEGVTEGEQRLLIQSYTQTVRAIGPVDGNEKWNFSVTQQEVTVYPSCNIEKDARSYLQPNDLKAVAFEGILYSVGFNDPKLHWLKRFESPIVHIWHIANGRVVRVNPFDDRHTSRLPAQLYLGFYHNQPYIHENDFDYAEFQKPSMMMHHKKAEHPSIVWNPYLITSNVASAVISPSGLLTLESADYETSQSTAMDIFHGHSDLPSIALYLSPQYPIKVIINVSTVHEDSSFPDTSLEIILIHWWKEIGILFVMTVYLLNMVIAIPLLHTLHRHFKARIDDVLRRRNVNVFVIEKRVEVPVEVQIEIPVPVQNSASHSSVQSASSSHNQSDPFVSRFTADFDTVRSLGKGGFGIVFECRNKIDDIHYAVKRIRLPDEEKAKKKVMREVKFLAKLDHAHIVRYFNTWLERPPPGWQAHHDSQFIDDGSIAFQSQLSSESPTTSSFVFDLRPASSDDDGEGEIAFSSSGGIVFENKDTSSASCDDVLSLDRSQHAESPSSKLYLYIVMQLCRKDSLRDWLQSNTLRPRTEVLHMFYEICLGVEYVHREGLIHRDLKPNNIFFSKADGTINIGDFGLVTGNENYSLDEHQEDWVATVNNHDRSCHTDKVGTELYMSPEQRISKRSYNHKVDIYSLGLIFFELLVPFSTQMERARALQDLRNLRFPSSFAKNTLDYKMLLSMLSHKPDERPEASEILNSDLLSAVKNN